MQKIILSVIVSLILITSINHVFAQSSDNLAVIETNLGNIVIEFFPADAPNHVDNFINLSNSGFYDGTLFHRICEGFMIQGGDPNTIDGDPSSWGLGGPEKRIDAELNTIKHDRGIVSMARSNDYNSAGSQFFIVHKDSNTLDGEYTVFGRIVTEESFETLDKIASIETMTFNNPNEKCHPVDPESVRLNKIQIINKNEISNVLELPEPERIPSELAPIENQTFENIQHDMKFSVPAGWLLQEPEKTQENSPDVVAVGPKVASMNPVISVRVQETDQRTIDDLILEKDNSLVDVINSGTLTILSKEKTSVNGNDAYVINAKGVFSANNETFDVQFQEVLIRGHEKTYTLAYSNDVSDFDSQLPMFEETLDSFEMLSASNRGDDGNSSDSEGGGCLIATATFGSEMADQVQQLRELRDNVILSKESGIAFMTGFNQIYYSFSPTVADLERENPFFKEFVKLTITPMIATLSILNHVDIDSEEDLLSYGLGVILLNVGIYFAIPAAIIYKIRR